MKATAFFCAAIALTLASLSAQIQTTGPAAPVASPTPPAKELAHQNLTGKDFTGSNFANTKFLRVRLNDCTFDGANLDGTSFLQVSLVSANLTGAILGPATRFQESTLNDANLQGLDMKGADFHRSTLRGANLKDTKGWGDISDCTFSGANICGADLSAAKGDLSTVQWSGAIYSDATKFPQGIKAEDTAAKKQP